LASFLLLALALGVAVGRPAFFAFGGCGGFGRGGDFFIMK
jgi:hypothetical protein